MTDKKAQAKARRQLAKMEREYAQMPPELAAYWRGSISHSYVARIADGNFKTIEVK